MSGKDTKKQPGNSGTMSPLRLPYYSQLESEYGIDKAAWRVLIETIWPNASSIDSVIMAIAYCRARKLDPLKRVVHIVPMYNSALKKNVETVWPGIGELRTTAFRTGQYAGMDAAEIGPIVTEKFTGSYFTEKREVTVTFPEWMRVTVYRMVGGQRCAFVGPRVYWKETYAQWKGTSVPNERWCRAPIGQLEKCADAAALRAAFPEELGNEYAAEEMEGRIVIDGAAGPAGSVGASSSEPPPPSSSPEPSAAQTAKSRSVSAEPPAPAGSPLPASNPPDGHADKQGAAHGGDENAADERAAANVEDVLMQFANVGEDVRDIDDLLRRWDDFVQPYYDSFSKDEQARLDRKFREIESALPEAD